MAAFGLLVIRRRFTRRREQDRTAVDGVSIAGILLQSVGFAIASMGQVLTEAFHLDPLSLALVLLPLSLGMGAAALFWASTRALGENWSLVARTREQHELVRHGPFAHVRHPIYLAMMLLLLSLAIGLGHWRQLFLAIPIFLIGTAVRVRSEERLLKQAFGRAFDDYARSVPALIPRL